MIDRRAKPSSMVVMAILSVVIGCVLFACVRSVLDRTMDSILVNQAQSRAEYLASRVAQNITEFERVADRGAPSSDYIKHLISMSQNGENLLHIRLFNTRGIMKFAYSVGAPPDFVPDDPTPLVQNTISENSTRVELLNSPETGPSLSRLVYAIVPIHSDDGRLVGIIDISFDDGKTAHMFETSFGWILFAVPIMAVLAFLIPTSAWLFVQLKNLRTRALVEVMKTHDKLTGLLNRSSFASETARHLEQQTGHFIPTGLLLLDLHNFRGINDAHGHEIADDFLIHVTRIIEGAVRENDVIARFGGDEFGVLLPDVAEFELSAIANRILLRLGEPFRKQGKKVSTAAYIGTYLAEPGDTQDDIMHAVELAQSKAKETGPNSIVKYTSDLDDIRKRKRRIESALRDAWEMGRASLAFQPVFRSINGEVAGFEALMRLKDHGGAQISPEEFIGIAEKNGMIHHLGLEALRVAMKAALEWPPTTFVAVNMSPAQFQKGDIVQQVAWLLDELAFPADRLEIEITESLLLEDEPGIKAQFQGLKDLGVSIAMDDFGTGHSSLSHLIEHDFDKLKIDRIFLTNLETEPERQTNILQSIVALGRQFGMTVTMEGIETQAHVDLLTSMGCDLLQGFHFSEPVPAEKVPAILDRPAIGGAA